MSNAVAAAACVSSQTCEECEISLVITSEFTLQRLAELELIIPSPEELFSDFRFCKICV